jgi:hypothetical protein
METLITLIVFLVIAGSVIKNVMEKLAGMRGDDLSDEERRVQERLRRVLGSEEAETEAVPPPPPPVRRPAPPPPRREAPPPRPRLPEAKVQPTMEKERPYRRRRQAPTAPVGRRQRKTRLRLNPKRMGMVALLSEVWRPPVALRRRMPWDR